MTAETCDAPHIKSVSSSIPAAHLQRDGIMDFSVIMFDFEDYF